MLDSKICQCPYCGADTEIEFDTSAGSAAYIEDCQVCCQPIQVRIELGFETDDWAHQEPTVWLSRDDD